ncbi:MAG TPA: Ig-like domain-containing protein [Candidatus Saccharimonadales bacterium]|jgi:hypothetical protein
MKKHSVANIKLITRFPLFVMGLFLLLSLFSTVPFAPAVLDSTASAACITTTPPATYGKVTQTVNVATAGTYRVWSRIKAPSTSANSYYFQVDTGCHYNVGDSTSIPVNTWTWVNYQDASAAAPIDISFSAGTHTLTYTGKEADVQLDKIMLLVDTACVPTGFGDNCASSASGPTVSLTSPAGGSTATGTVNISANASDTAGISKVDFLVDGAIVSTDTTAAYSYAWNSTTVSNGSHTITARATNTGGSTTTSSAVTVNVSNAPPTGNVSIPFRMNAGGPAFTDPTGATWAADSYVTGGASADRGTIAIAGTTNPQIYRSERWGMSSYNIPVANGTYTYRLHFAETTGSGCAAVGAGCRIFSVTGEGAPIITNLDIFATVGGNTALVRTGTITVADGNATFGFSATANAAEVNGIELLSTTPTGDTTPPSTSITAPANGSSVTVGTQVTVNANASDNVGVSKVEFYVDGAMKSTDTASPYSYVWSTTGVTAGAHTLTSRAYDAAGNATTSTAVSVNVTGGTTTPLPGDVNGDSRVNALDLSALISHDGENYPAADFNSDGTVGAADMAILLSRWTW